MPTRGASAALTAGTVVGLLADPGRMQVLAAVALGASSDELPQRAGLSARDAAAALHRLQAAGLVTAALDVAYDRLRELAADATASEPDPDGLQPFVQDRQLRSLPAQSSRRRRVLEHVAAQTFSPEECYEEAAVNDLLRVWCEGGEVDHAALRRYLVEEGLMSRGRGVYRRSAGTVEPGPGERLVRAMGLA